MKLSKKVYDSSIMSKVERNVGVFVNEENYISTIDIYRSRYGNEIDINKYQELYDELKDKAVIFTTYSYYEEGETNPENKYISLNMCWYKK